MAGNASSGFPAFPISQNQDELEYWVLSVDEFVQTKFATNNQNGQVMSAVRTTLLQEDKYKTWISNLMDRQDQRLKERL